MFRASVGCLVCNKEFDVVQAPTLDELSGPLGSLLVACHAATPHCPHPLRFAISGSADLPEEDLLIQCLQDKCPAHLRELRTRAPLQLVGALTILFHTSHEGHPIKLVVGSREWSSPA